MEASTLPAREPEKMFIRMLKELGENYIRKIIGATRNLVGTIAA